MKQKKQRVKLFNPLTEEVETILSKIKHNLTSCPLPSDIEDLVQSIFNTLLDSIPDINPDADFNNVTSSNNQILDKKKNKFFNSINFDGFWAEWLKFRASVWSLSSISVVDDIYESYIKERIEELKIIIDNVENQEQLTAPVIKHEFMQAKDLVDKAFLNLQNIIFNEITNFDDFDDDDDKTTIQKKEKERISNLMSHRTQIRRIKDDFTSRYKNFFQLSSQERSITDVQHRRCISIIEEMLNALNKLEKQRDNFYSLKGDLYSAEQDLSTKIIPKPKNVSVVFIYEDQDENIILPEDAESENAEIFINNFLSSRNNSPYNSPLTSPDNKSPQQNSKKNSEQSNSNNNNNNSNVVTPIKKNERTWKTPEPQAPPVRIQPLNLHELSSMPDSFKDLSKRFNTSDSESQSTPSSPDNKKAFKQQQKKKQNINSKRPQPPQNKKREKTVTFVKEKPQTSTVQKDKHASTMPPPSIINTKSNNNNNSKKPSPNAAQTAVNNSNSMNQQPQQKQQQQPPQQSILKESDNIKEETSQNQDIPQEDRGESQSTSSYTSDNEDPATVSNISKVKPSSHPSDDIMARINKHHERIKNGADISSPKEKSEKSSPKNSEKGKKATDPVVLYQQQQQQQQKIKQQAATASGRFSSSFLRPKRLSADTKSISSSSNIFSSSSPLNHSLDNLTFKSKTEVERHRHSLTPKKGHMQTKHVHFSTSSSSAPASPTPQSRSQSTSASVSPGLQSNNRNREAVVDEEFEEEEEEENVANYEVDDRDEITKLKDDYESLNIQLNVYSEENKELQAANEEIPFLKKKLCFYEELEMFYDDEVQRLIQTQESLSSKLKKKTKDESAYLENSRLHREKDQLFAKLQSVQKELSAITSRNTSSKELLLMLHQEKEKNDKLSRQIREMSEKVHSNLNNDEKRELFEAKSESLKQQIQMQNLNLKIIHLKSKVKRYKIRLNSNDSSQAKESKIVENLENEIAAIRNSFESIQDLRFSQQDQLFKEQTKNAFLQSTIAKLKQKIGNPRFDIESDVMNELREKIQENFALKDENEKVKSTLFELYHLICGEALTDNVDDVTILLDGIRQHLVLEEMKK